ncbi:MAG: DUF2336 domain-containing protein [Pseudomonadota bacterium]|nr:DUF2336 domain-containing protein [Pseudomonadota bacterium]
MNETNQSTWPSPDMAPLAASPRRVSADSFRRLTALLKKLEPSTTAVRDLASVVIALPTFAVPIEVAPVAVVPVIAPSVAEPAREPEVVLQPVLAPEPELVFEPELELAPEPEPELVLEPVLAPEPEAVAAPIVVLPEVPVEMLAALPQEMLHVELAVEPEPVVAVVAEIPQNIPKSQVEEIHLTSVPEAFIAPIEEPAPPPVAMQVQPLRAAPSLLRRQPKRDVFDEVLTVPKTIVVEQLSPEQEAEQTELARSLIDMMSGAGAGGGQPHERALAADTLLRMLPRLAQSIRTVLAQRLSMMDTPPSILVSRLLVDPDVSVSGPLLEDCMQIADENFFPLINQRNQEQLRLIARRRRLSRAVTEALIAVGDASVLLTLVRNAAAEIPQEGFMTLARVASENPELLAPLCIRQDLPIHTAFELFWPAPVQLRRYLLTRFLTDTENLTRILRITMKGEEGGSSDISVEDVGAGLVMALAGQTAEAAVNVAAAVKVAPATIERIFADTSGEAMMALLKVAGISRAQLETNLPNLAAGDFALINPNRNFEELQAVFDQLSYTKARILLTYWDWASNQSGPYATHH